MAHLVALAAVLLFALRPMFRAVEYVATFPRNSIPRTTVLRGRSPARCRPRAYAFLQCTGGWLAVVHSRALHPDSRRVPVHSEGCPSAHGSGCSRSGARAGQCAEWACTRAGNHRVWVRECAWGARSAGGEGDEGEICGEARDEKLARANQGEEDEIAAFEGAAGRALHSRTRASAKRSRRGDAPWGAVYGTRGVLIS
jgi:hypothetical protein